MIDVKVERKKYINFEQLIHHSNKEFLPTAAKIVLSEAILRVPVDKGLLRESLGDRVEGNIGIVYANTHYAAHVEYGTIKMKAQPYLRPALINNSKKLRDLFESIYSKIARSMGRGR